MKRTIVLLAALLATGTYLSGKEDRLKEDAWTIVAGDYDTAYTGVPVANGRIGILPWKEPFSIKHIMLNNVMERLGGDMVNCSVRGINPMGLSMKVDGKIVEGGSISGWSQALDMKKAVHVTWFTVPGKVQVRYSVAALRNLPYSMMMNVEVRAMEDVDVEICNAAFVPSEYKAAESVKKTFHIDGRRLDMLYTEAVTLNGRYDVSAASMFVCNPGLERTTENDSDVLRFRLPKGESESFSLIGSVCSTADFNDPRNEAVRQLVYIDRIGVGEVMAGHRAAWEELWRGDIEIEGDMEAQHAVRLALFNLYGFCAEGTRLSVSPMGLSSNGYNGHVFWDTEMWMFPPMLLMNCGIARSMMDYRTDRIAAARRRAAASGYKGAMFPWESDSFGEESTPVWALTGPMEHHITADIGIAAWNYWCVTGDRKWLADEGMPLLSDVAEFWESRVRCNGDGTFSISGVVGADEYAVNVTDNAFTNGAASAALRCAVKAAALCGRKAPEAWSEIADGLRILRDGVTLEYEGYDGWMIKQADVNLLGYPLGLVSDRKQMLRDLEYYESRIDPQNGPAMTFSIFCVQYARLGMAAKAEEMFRRSYRPNSRPPFGALAETPVSDNPYFATAAGGLLQAVLFAFGGSAD